MKKKLETLTAIACCAALFGLLVGCGKEAPPPAGKTPSPAAPSSTGGPAAARPEAPKAAPPVVAEPVKAEAPKVEPPKPEPAKPETAKTEPAKTESAPADAKLVVWVEDDLPAGANAQMDGDDNWTWVTENPAPKSGKKAHQSNSADGEHQHYYTDATDKLEIKAGDKLFAWVWLDAANPPKEVMLQWHEGDSWEHRAYWGANSIEWGTDATESRQSMGALPEAGKWVLLEVPADKVGLEGKTLDGAAFSLFGGKATWDAAGKKPAK